MNQQKELEQAVNILKKKYLPGTANNYDVSYTTFEIHGMIQNILPEITTDEVFDALKEAGFLYDHLEDVGFIWLFKISES